MSLHPSDYRLVDPAFRALFAGYITRTKPDRVSGTNFMTPELVGYVLVGGESVEITTGMGLFDREQRNFGVTFSRAADGTPDERDRLCSSLDEVAEYLGIAR